MRIFACPVCAKRMYFDNTFCRCGHHVLFDPDRQIMTSDGEMCSNRQTIGCNWIAESHGFCRSCAMTRIVPDIGALENIGLWAKTESAKRRMLARWGWFTPSDPAERPVFRLLSEQTVSGDARIVMGHE